MISKLLRLNVLSVLFLLGTTAQIIKADLEKDKQIKKITFINTTGYTIRLWINPVEQVLESSGNSETTTDNYVFNLQETSDPQTIELIRYEIRLTQPGKQEIEFVQLINMFAATEGTVQLMDYSYELIAETTIDITDIPDGSTYQIDYEHESLTVTCIS